MSPTGAETPLRGEEDAPAEDQGAAVAEASHRCRNCGAALSGHYCATCGQKNHDYAEPFRDVVEEFASEHFNFDAKFFRTVLPLLFRPGFLTVEYFAGRRARYLGPVRLYIFSSILLFFVAWTFAPLPSLQDRGAAGDKAATAAAAKIAKNPHLSAQQKKELTKAVGGKLPKTVSGKLFGRKFNVNTVELAGAFKQTFEQWLPRLLFVFVPLVALLLKLLYFRPKRYYMEHLVFMLHTHAFIFVAMLVMVSLQILSARASWLATPSGYIDFFIWCYMVVYVFLAMRAYYRQSFLRTLFKFLLSGLLYWTALVVVLSFGVSLILGDLLHA
ncbi:MAG TPA: DUF3667 domain-containing protein [Gammaproteobacteria bacterium]|nr:DUF3667 domain-containing protein [Gammaproteobacteria bacterium]